MCDCKKSTFIYKKEAGSLLTTLKIRTSLSKVPVLNEFLFQIYKMNEIESKILITGDTFQRTKQSLLSARYDLWTF